MNIRPLDLLDLPLIARYRNDTLTLDSSRALTRGKPLGAAGLLAYVNPKRRLYAGLVEGGASPLLGGIIQTRGEPFARLQYLAPASRLNRSELPALLEHLAAQAGTWGALHALAETEESSEIFPALRMAGFSVYAWERFWDASQIGETESDPPEEEPRAFYGWRKTRPSDLPAAQNLYYQIVPPLLQTVEATPKRETSFACGEPLKCYAAATAGIYGVVLTPLIHPDERDPGRKIAALVAGLPRRTGRKVYLRVRSYQAWLEPALQDLGAQALPRQAVMVKHLARLVKNEQPARATPSAATAQPSRVSRIKINE